MRKRPFGGGIKLKLMAASWTVNKYEAVPFFVSFDGDCLTSMRVASFGMHFVDIDSTVLLTVGEHNISLTNNYSKFLGLLCVLETLME